MMGPTAGGDVDGKDVNLRKTRISHVTVRRIPSNRGER